MGFYDFTRNLDYYSATEKGDPAVRLNKRHDFLIKPFLGEIRGAQVLDLAAHDGRWSYGFAGAGAANVLGVEARGELIDRFRHYPNPDLKKRVTLKQNDLFSELEQLVKAGAKFDVVAVFGILYHIMDHHRLFLLLRRLDPGVIIVDSDFIVQMMPMIRFIRERTDKVLNAVSHFSGQTTAIKGVPSFGAMEAIAQTLGYAVAWMDWSVLPENERPGVRDYFRPRDMRRATCALRPV